MFYAEISLLMGGSMLERSRSIIYERSLKLTDFDRYMIKYLMPDVEVWSAIFMGGFIAESWELQSRESLRFMEDWGILKLFLESGDLFKQKPLKYNPYKLIEYRGIFWQKNESCKLISVNGNSVIRVAK